MTTRREYLVTLGLAKPGRGKFSKEGNAAIDKARASGTKFSDDEPKPVKPPKATASVPKPEPVGIIAEVVYTYAEDEWNCVEVTTGVKRGMRDICKTCGVSLVGHGCLSPRIVARDGRGDVAVKLVRK